MLLFHNKLSLRLFHLKDFFNPWEQVDTIDLEYIDIPIPFGVQDEVGYITSILHVHHLKDVRHMEGG